MKTEIETQKEYIEHIRDRVKLYLSNNSHYIPNFDWFDKDQVNHIINIGTSIICANIEIGYEPGSFVKAIVNNDLRGAFSAADDVNTQCIRFYVMMIYNMSF